MFKLDLEKGEESEIKWPTSIGSQKKQDNSRKISISSSMTKAFGYVHQKKLWKILKAMVMLDHLTCLLKNLYAGQEAAVGPKHGTMDWFQIVKGVHQGCIL